MEAIYEFSGVLWEYSGEAPWVFITVGVEDGDEIHDRVIGETEWSTSIFPDKGSGSYVLPIKRSVRDQEKLAVGDLASVILRIDLE